MDGHKRERTEHICLASSTCVLSNSYFHLSFRHGCLRHMQLSSSRFTHSHIIKAAQTQSAPRTRETENVSLKGDAEDAALKVFADDTKGIVCYRTESGEIVCEGMDEGPQFYPPSGANFYMPDTRAAAILPLLGEVMYEI
ncbi:hypothetical protein GOP47_0023902 [Adiantum capillus-veneris]|uniref:Uncharacterized protein n=1 Tax=Adiantum capillus-veneris TaxID=13818 RepID=A0A9D4U4T0_ADICA|nr:hypothetical protein GOP47_0023902 [Adiantum capillus-veneris]